MHLRREEVTSPSLHPSNTLPPLPSASMTAPHTHIVIAYTRKTNPTCCLTFPFIFLDHMRGSCRGTLSISSIPFPNSNVPSFEVRVKQSTFYYKQLQIQIGRVIPVAGIIYVRKRMELYKRNRRRKGNKVI